MPALMRPRLTCFYCGARSVQTRKNGLRQWKCEKCEAVNYLDEHGEITDPPASETPNPIRYAQQIPRSASPVNLPASDISLFCSTCLKNQHLLTQALATYLPAPSDPRYDAFEQSYPAYRRSLEERYPQVCLDCAPAVEAKIRAAGYAAKTDHLRRLMERTKAGGRRNKARGNTWQELIVGCAGFIWWASLVIQVLWHILGVVRSTEEVEYEVKEGFQASLAAGLLCIVQAAQTESIHRDCIAWTARPVGVAIVMGLATMWWNNKLSERTQTPQARIIGRGDYIKLQVVVMGVRGAAWWWLRDQEAAGVKPVVYRAAHAFVALFISVAAIASTRLVTLDNTPRVSFHEQSEPLAARTRNTRDQRPNVKADLAAAATKDFSRQLNPYDQPFPVSKLGSPMPPKPSLTSLNPPTPPDEDSDAMDWTPSQEAKQLFNPNPVRSNRSSKPLLSSPSPFYGRLPTAPIAPAHNLRNPPQKPLFRKATEEQQKSFFQQMTKQAPAGASDGLADHDDDSVNGKAELNMAAPKFFLKDDAVETGLEAMFDSVFSIGDEPKEVAIAQQVEVSYEESRARQEKRRRKEVFMLLTFGACVVPVGIALGVAWFKAFP